MMEYIPSLDESIEANGSNRERKRAEAENRNSRDPKSYDASLFEKKPLWGHIALATHPIHHFSDARDFLCF